MNTREMALQEDNNLNSMYWLYAITYGHCDRIMQAAIMKPVRSDLRITCLGQYRYRHEAADLDLSPGTLPECAACMREVSELLVSKRHCLATRFNLDKQHHT